mgnify:CR=1 FL=1
MERKPLTQISYRQELYIDTAHVDIDVNGTTTSIDVDDFTAVVNVVIRMRDLMDLDNERLEWLVNTSKEILNEREVEVIENSEVNRLQLSEAIWDSLSLDAIREQFIFQNLERYKTDPNAFEEDSAMMGLDDEGGE